MAHNLELQANGNYSYIGKDSAWHDLGLVTGELVDYQQIKEYCLGWTAEKKQLVSPYDGTTPIDAYGIFRSDNQAFLGAVGEKYNPLSHDLGFAIVSQLLEEEKCFATAGVLGKGEKIFGLGYISDSLLGDDKSKNFLLFTTSYDGLSKFGFKVVKERVVCSNTLQIALNEMGKFVSVKHTRNAETLLKDRLKALEYVKASVKSMDERLAMLANRKMDKDTTQEIFARLFPMKEAIDKDGNKIEISPKRREGILADILALYDSNDDNTFPEQRGTAYNLLNAITNYVDHARATHGEDSNRSMSALFGSGEMLKQEAFEVILDKATGLQELVRVAPVSVPETVTTSKKKNTRKNDATVVTPADDFPVNPPSDTPTLDSILS